MVDEVVRALSPSAGEVMLDGTFGAGGYSRRLLDEAPCRVIAIDRDPTAIKAGARMAADYDGRLELVEGRFSDMVEILRARGIDAIAGVALDLGVSSMQIDDGERGFSFMHDGPLDMRMEQRGETAADVVNTVGQDDLADIIYEFGEERRSRAIARAIVRRREERLIERTADLAQVVASALGPRGNARLHPATRTFQALRIYVNRELSELGRGLLAAEKVLAPDGRLAVVSFHSLEDRQVKQFLQQRAGIASKGSRHFPAREEVLPAPSFRLLKRGTVKPSAAEESANPRARSARLRIAVRTAAPAWPEGSAESGGSWGGDAS